MPHFSFHLLKKKILVNYSYHLLTVHSFEKSFVVTTMILMHTPNGTIQLTAELSLQPKSNPSKCHCTTPAQQMLQLFCRQTEGLFTKYNNYWPQIWITFYLTTLQMKYENKLHRPARRRGHLGHAYADVSPSPWWSLPLLCRTAHLCDASSQTWWHSEGREQKEHKSRKT